MSISRLRSERRAPHAALGLIAFCAVPFLLFCTVPVRSPADVLLITSDTLRADHLSLYGYSRPTTPNLDRLMKEGMVFERAYSTASTTPPSVVSILSGVPPDEHGVRQFYQLMPADLRMIPDLLPEEYQSAAFISSAVLTDDAIGMARHFEHYDDFVDEKESERGLFERSAGRTTDAVLSWLRSERDDSRPVFLWVHYIDPHGPYAPPPESLVSFEHEGLTVTGTDTGTKTYEACQSISIGPYTASASSTVTVTAPSIEMKNNTSIDGTFAANDAVPAKIDFERILDYMRIPGIDDGLEYIDRYDEEIAYLDAELGRLLDEYSRLRPLDDMLVIFTADHGESMMDHDQWFRHGYHVYEEIVRVPLVIRGPGVSTGRSDATLSILDIAPTVLRFAGVKVPADLDGLDLRGPLPDDSGRAVFAESRSSGWKAAVQGKRKWMARVRSAEGEVVETRYYDLSKDAGELEPAEWTGENPIAARLLELCRSDTGVESENTVRGTRISEPKISPRVGEQEREKLRALGYLDESAQ